MFAKVDTPQQERTLRLSKKREIGGGSVLRCFVAVEVAAPQLRRNLEGVQNALRRLFGTPDPVKWVPAHQFHYTLKFLGDTAQADLSRVLGGVERAVKGVAAFEARVAGLGSFPSPERPSVLWAGLSHGAADLSALAAGVERELAGEGFPPERRAFKPHLTLGRVREGARVPAGVGQFLERSTGQDFGPFRVERVVLMKSELTPRGPIYTVIGAVGL